jgi:hypothetical protein
MTDEGTSWGYRHGDCIQFYSCFILLTHASFITDALKHFLPTAVTAPPLAAPAPAPANFTAKKLRASHKQPCHKIICICTYQYLITFLLLFSPFSPSSLQSFGVSRKSPHASGLLRSCRLTHHCRETRAACAPCPFKHLETPKICRLLSATKHNIPSICHFLLLLQQSHYLSLTHLNFLLFRSMDSWTK